MAGRLSLSPGELLGDRYRLSERIGSGGMASVWLAADERLGREVAVKLLAEGLAADPAFAARFRREARVAASLRHPNLVQVFDFDPDGPRPHLVMEYVPGPDLAEHLAGPEPVGIERLAGDLLAALEAIHEAGVVHRDVKPQNVLLAPGGRAMLTDFGIARPEDATSITQTGQMPGTGRYMAPELLQGDPATPASDLYACGVVLGEALRDSPGHDGVRALVARLTAPDPRDRPPSASAALSELLRPRPPLELASVDAPAQRPAAAARRRPQARTIRIDRSRLVAGLALAGVAGLVALLIALSGGGDQASGPGRDARTSAGDASGAEDGSEGGDGAGRRASQAEVPAPAPDPDPAQGTALNQQGFELIQQGRAEEAIPVLREAVAAFPAGTDDLDYAYALFNLGQALTDAGRPDEAIPVLRRRLRIPNQTATVRAELDAAIDAAE